MDAIRHQVTPALQQCHSTLGSTSLSTSTIKTDEKPIYQPIKLTAAEMNTLKWEVHKLLRSAAQSSPEDFSLQNLTDDACHSVLTQLHSSRESSFSAALNEAGFKYTNKLQARHAIEKLMTSIGVDGISFMKKKLSQVDLSNQHVGEEFFSQADMTYSNFTKAVMERTYLNKTNLGGGDLTDAKLLNVRIVGADFNRTILERTIITLELPEEWDASRLNYQLNHMVNGSSLFTAISSMGDKYENLKINLMHQIIDSLERQNTDISCVNKAFIDVFEKNPILRKDEKICSFIARKGLLINA